MSRLFRSNIAFKPKKHQAKISVNKYKLQKRTKNSKNILQTKEV